MAMRFQGITINQGAAISSAYLNVNSSLAYSGALSLLIEGEDVDDASTFSTVGDYNGRTRTSANVTWTITSDWVVDTWYESPNISSIIQEIVDRESWTSGNDIVIFVEDDGSSVEKRQIYHYEYGASVAPKLTITYESDETPPTFSEIQFTETAANNPCTFKAKCNDDTGLSGYIFGTNNTGSWANDTFASLSGTEAWASVEKTLYPFHGIRVEYQFWCNDTSNNWNNTEIQFLITEYDRYFRFR